jgi:hypothetical protein
MVSQPLRRVHGTSTSWKRLSSSAHLDLEREDVAFSGKLDISWAYLEGMNGVLRYPTKK